MLTTGIAAQTGMAQAVNFYGTFTNFAQSAVLYGNGIAADANANLYLTGTANLGYIPRNSDGTYGSFLTPRIDTSGSGAYGLAIDAGNNLYRVDYLANTVAKFTYAGVNSFTRSYINTNGTVTASPLAGWVNPSSVAVDNAGDVYVLNSGSGNVVKLTPNGSSYTASTVYGGSALVAAAGLSVDNAGNLYFTSGPTSSALAGYASSPNPGVYKLSPGCGSYCQTSLGTGWSSPSASAVDSAGNLWVADHGAGIVYLLTPSSGSYTQSAWATIPLVSRLTISTSGQLFAMTDGSQGDSVIWIGGTAPHNFGLVNVGSSSATAGVVVNFASTVNSASFSVLTQGLSGLDFADAGSDTCVQNQTYFAGSTCTVYVKFNPKAAGLRSGVLVVKDSNGSAIGTNLLYGTGVAPVAVMNGAPPATFIGGISAPANMTFDASGNLFVASNTGSGNVYEYSSSGSLKKIFPGIYGPVAALEDSVGNVFTYSSGGCCSNSLVEYTPSGGILSFPFYTAGQIIGSLAQDTSGNFYLPDTHGIAAGLIKLTQTGAGYSESHLLPSQTVYAVALDGSGNLFATTANNTIWKIAPDGASTQVVSAGLNQAFGIAADTAGNLYVTNLGSNSVVEIFAAGGYQQQSILASGFTPEAVAVDAQGNVYVGDLNNSRIVKINRATASLTFDAATVGSQSVDSPKNVVLQNIGNAALTVPAPSQGTNPAVTSGFALDSATTCPVVNSSGAAGTLGAGATCFYEIDAIPAAPGVNAGYVTLADNNLGVIGSTQSITLTGTGLGIKNIAFPALTSPVTVGAAAPLGATASNGDAVTYTVLSGSATLAGSTVTFTATGTVTIEASSAATSTYGAAIPVTQTITVNPAPTSYAAPTTSVEATSTPQTATINFTIGGTLASISVVTQGATGKDFNVAPGGTCAVGVVYDPGQACTVNYTFTPLSPGTREGAVVLKGTSGTVLGTSYLGGVGTGPLGLFTTATQTLSLSGLNSVRGISLDGNGNLYGFDTAPGVVAKFAAGSTAETVLAYLPGSGAGGATAVDGAGNLFVMDTAAATLYEFVGASGPAITVASGIPASDDNLEVDGSGNLYYSGYGSSPMGAIYKVAAGTHQITTLVPGNLGHRFVAMAVDPAGNIFAPDFSQNILFELPAGSNTLVTLASGGYLSNPHGVAVDPAGNIYVTNINGSNVIRYATGTYAATLLPAAGQRGVALDGAGNLYTITSDRTIGEFTRTQATPFTFVNTPVGNTGSSQNGVLFENDGNADLAITGYSATSPFALNGSQNTCGMGTLASGASCVVGASFSPLNVGPYSGTATITDNTLGVAGTAQTIALSGTAIQGSQTITFAALSPVTYGATPITLAATGGPSGNPVTFNVLSGPGSISGNVLTVMGAGSIVIAANQAASTNYMAAPQVTQALAVYKAAKSITFPALASPVVVNSTATLSATSSSGDLVVYSVTAGAATITGNGITFTNAGSVTIEADSPETANYLAAASVTQTITVNAAPVSYIASTTPVDSASAVQTATVNFTTGGTLGSISVVTQGATGKDFNIAPGGTCSVGVAYTAGQACTVNYIFAPQYPGLRMGGIQLMRSTGGVLGTSLISGTGTGPQLTFLPPASTNIGSGFQSPSGLAVDGNGDIFVADHSHGMVKEIMAVNGSIPANPTINIVASGIGPDGLALDGAGNLYVADTNTDSVKEFLAVAGVIPPNPSVLTLAGGFTTPNGLAVDANGNIFVVDSGALTVTEIPAGCNTSVTPGCATPLTDLSSPLTGPMGIAVDGYGNLFVGNGNNHQRTVLEIHAVNGKVPTNGASVTQVTSLVHPYAIAVDANGNLFVADYASTAVYELLAVNGQIPASPTVLTVFSGVTYADGIALDASGNIYVSDASASIHELNVSMPPAMNFGSQVIESSSAAQTLTLVNRGNAALNFQAPTSSGSLNPSLPVGFVYGSGSTCTQIGPGSSGFTLAPGNACTQLISFAPATIGSFSGAIAEQTNNLNVPGTVQSIGVSGTGTVLPNAIQFPQLVSPAMVGTSVTLGATSTSGQVSYSVTAGAATITGSTLLYTNAGAVTITASSPASGNYAAAAPVSWTVNVSPAPVSYLAPTTAVASSSAVQTATVNFSAGGTLGTISVVTQGATGKDFNVAPGGTCTVGTTYTAGQACSINYTFAPLAPGTREGAIVLSDAGGNLLGTSYLGGTGNGPLGLFAQGTISTAVNASGGVYDIVEDGSGNLYVNNSGTVRKIAAGTQNETVLATNARSGALGIDGAGNVYYNANNQLVKLVAGTSNAVTLTGQLCFIDIGITVDAQGNIYLPCTDGQDRIIRLAAGTLAETDFGLGSLNHPIGVSVDGSGNMFVSDNGNGRIAEITPANVVTTVASIQSPGRNAFDAAGNLLVAHQSSTITKFASGFTSNTSIATGLGFSFAFTMDPEGNLYVLSNGGQINLVTRNTAAEAFGGSTPAGTSATGAPIGFENDGNQVLQITGISAGTNNFTVGTPGASAGSSASQLLPSGTLSIPLSFTPQSVGNLSDALSIADNSLNASAATQQVALTGTATQQTPVVTASPATINYSSTPTSLSASVSFVGSIVPTGAVTFSVDGGAAVAATCTGSSSPLSCTASYPSGMLSVPTHTIQASIASDTDFTTASGTATLTVNPIAPTISFTVGNHTYGDSAVTLAATSNSTGSFTYSLVSGPATISGSTLTITGAGPVTVQASEAANGNYTAGTLNASFTVSQAQLGVAISGTPTKTYDATTAAALTPANFAVTGLVGSDSITINQSAGSFASANAGAETVTATLAPANYVAASGSLSNYILPASATGAGLINQALAAVTPTSATKVYGQSDPAFTGTLTGFVSADNVTATYTRAAGETVLGGPYAISASLAPAGVLSNYRITYNTALFTITPATATVNFGNVVQTYTSGPLAPTVTTVPAGVAYSVVGAPDIAAGSYSVTATITNPNYVGSGSTAFTVLQAPATIALSNLSQAYSGTPESATATVAPAYCGPAAVTYNGNSAAPSNIGTYPVIASMANPNCTAPNAAGTLIINAFAASSCVYALNPTAHSAFSVSDGSSVAAQCSIQVNSAARDAFDVDGHGTTINATAISVVGGAAVDRSSTVNNAPVTGQSSAADPLAAVVAPTVGTCINAGNHGWDGDDGYGPGNKPITLNPGTYCGGIAIHARSTVTLNPGTYILLGGGLTIDGGAQVTGTGVTFYNTANRTHPYQPVHIDGGSKTALSAPISGPLAGVLFFQDRNLAQKNADHDHDNDSNQAQPNVITGNTESTFAGALYFPTTSLVYSGGAEQDPAAYTLIVADTVSIAAHSNVSLTVLGKPMSDTDSDACSPGPGKDCDHDKDGDHR